MTHSPLHCSLPTWPSPEGARPPGEARVRTLRLGARAGDGPRAREALALLERAALRSLERAAGAIGDEVVVLDRFSARLTLGEGEGGPLASLSLREALSARLVEAARRAPSHARFASVASAEAAYIGALLSGGEGVFPFSALGHLGRSPFEVLARAAARGRLALADLLAALAGSLPAEALAGAIGQAEARLSLERLLSDDAPLAASPPPSRVLVQVLSFGRSLGLSGERRRALLAAKLYSLWPPCRVVVLDPRWLEEPLPAGSTLPPCDRPRPAGQAGPGRSSLSHAGGLVLWASLLRGSGLLARLASAYPSPSALGAALFALGRSLVGPSAKASDPLLSLFAGGASGGEAGGEGPAALFALDPEPMAVAALSWARDAGLLDRPLGLAPIGDRMVATTPDHLVVDSVEASCAEAAAPAVVARFAARVGRPPPTLRSGAAQASLLDRVAEIDAPALPPALRQAVLTFASCLRSLLWSRAGVRPRSLWGWAALLEPGRVVLRQADVGPSLRGARLPVRVALGPECLEVVVA